MYCGNHCLVLFGHCRKEDDIDRYNMDPSKNHNLVQLNSSERQSEGHYSEPQMYRVDPSGHVNMNLLSSEMSASEAKPVLN